MEASPGINTGACEALRASALLLDTAPYSVIITHIRVFSLRFWMELIQLCYSIHFSLVLSLILLIESVFINWFCYKYQAFSEYHCLSNSLHPTEIFFFWISLLKVQILSEESFIASQHPYSPCFVILRCFFLKLRSRDTEIFKSVRVFLKPGRFWLQ